MIIYFMLKREQMQRLLKFNKSNLIQLLLVLVALVPEHLNFIGKLRVKKRRGKKRKRKNVDALFFYSFLLTSIKGYAGDQIEMNQLPENTAIQSISNGLATAWKHYGNPT